jgi:translation initiation factor 2-alpha kinase 4
MNIQRKLYVSPLGSVNAKFYDDGILFQCVLERKSNRVVIAAGGRYDGLIRTYKRADMRSKTQGAVGVSIGLDPIISNMAKNSENNSKKSYLKKPTREESVSKRCDVLVICTGTEAVKLAGIKLLTSFWANDISAELSADRTPRAEEYSLMVSMRHEASTTVKVTTSGKDSEETEVSIASLAGYVQQELRERDMSKLRQHPLQRQPSHADVDRKGNVQVLLARHGSKKSNKYQIVSDAQDQWSRKLDEAKSAPILAVETRDDVIDLIQQTRLSDAESWRKAIQSVSLNDRQYVQQIQEMLNSWRKQWAEGDGMREACVFNFRTQHCIYYDLGL